MAEIDLSIIIPTYNRLPLLKEALDSFIGLLDCSYEVIIVDDGSTDETWQHLQTLRSPIRVFRQENAGSNAARNLGLEKAQGEYLRFLDSDDLLIPSNTIEQVQYLKAHPEVDVCYSDKIIWYESLNEKRHQPNYQITAPIDGLLSNHWGLHTASFAVKSVLAKLVKWSEHVQRHQEKDFVLRLAISGAKFAYLPGAAGIYRKHSGSKMTDGGYFELAQGQLIMYRQAEEMMRDTGQLTQARRRMLATRYFECAEHVFYFDRSMFRRIVQEDVFRVDPAFESERPRFRRVAKIVGLEKAEQIRHFLLRHRGIQSNLKHSR